MKWDAKTTKRLVKETEIKLISLYYKESKYPIFKVNAAIAVHSSLATDIVDVIEHKPYISGNETYVEAKYYLVGHDFQCWLNKKK